MKKKTHLLLFVVLAFLVEAFSLLPEAIGASGNCPDGIASYWNLNAGTGGVYQDVISNINGICGIGCPSTVSGAVDNSQMFDGATDSLVINADASFNWSASQSFTVELWLRRNSGTIDGGLEIFIGRADVSGLNWYLGINASGNAQAVLKASNGSGPASPLVGSKDLRSASSDPTWHHVALVRDGISMETTMYVDGQATASQTFNYTTGFASNDAPLTLGALEGDHYFGGGLDEVAIYSRDLSEDEIKQHYYLSRGYCSYYDEAIKIMPMGDSITKGVWTAGLPASDEMVSYRLDLSDFLENNLYWFDYIGSQHNGTGIDPQFDDEHAGFGGITDDQLYTLLATGVNQVPEPDEEVTNGPYLNYYPTEIILLHIGTNYLSTSPTDVENILDQIDSYSKKITVVLARIINQVPNDPDVPTFNDNVETMALNRISQGDKIIIVDMQTGASLDYRDDTTPLYTSGDMYDSLHPNPSGYSKISSQWFSVLETILPQSQVPLITSTALDDAVAAQPYSYTVAATGRPSPTFALITNPNNMTIDPATGLIQWTPASDGDYTVVVQATNWTGEDTKTFTLSVNSLPQAVSDAYSGILQGGSLTVPRDSGVLSNDTGASNLTAILVSSVSHGTLNLNADGSFTYSNDGSDNSEDQFTYKATDGTAETTPATVTLSITLGGGGGSSGGGGGGGCFISGLF
jgi:VCBS repeat-containing protein